MCLIFRWLKQIPCLKLNVPYWAFSKTISMCIFILVCVCALTCTGAWKPNSRVLISINFEQIGLQPQHSAVLEMELYMVFLHFFLNRKSWHFIRLQLSAVHFCLVLVKNTEYWSQWKQQWQTGLLSMHYMYLETSNFLEVRLLYLQPSAGLTSEILAL